MNATTTAKPLDAGHVLVCLHLAVPQGHSLQKTFSPNHELNLAWMAVAVKTDLKQRGLAFQGDPFYTDGTMEGGYICFSTSQSAAVLEELQKLFAEMKLQDHVQIGFWDARSKCWRCHHPRTNRQFLSFFKEAAHRRSLRPIPRPPRET